MSLFTFKCRLCLRLRSSSASSCLAHIQQSPHCFDSFNKKTTPLNAKHTTPNTTEHTNYTLQTCCMSQISQLSKRANSVTVSITVTVAVTLPPPSLPQLPPVPQQPNHVVCHIILWLVGVVPFSTNRKALPASTSCLRTLSWEKPVFIVSSCFLTKQAANVMAMLAKKRAVNNVL